MLTAQEVPLKAMDLFADALWKFYETGHATLRIERDDGYRSTEDIGWYLTTFRDFLPIEKQALKFARGRILDVGCGAGRHSLYLQNRGHRVTAIDVSPRAIELARTRGVQDARVASVCGRLPFRDGEFDTVLLFGNNLGICGTLPKFRRMLHELDRITSPRGRILATTRQPSTTSPRHKSYLRRNLERRRAIGQIRVRLVYQAQRAPWFDLLLLAPTDLMQIAAKEGWELANVFPLDSLEEGYAAVMEKRQ